MRALIVTFHFLFGVELNLAKKAIEGDLSLQKALKVYSIHFSILAIALVHI